MQNRNVQINEFVRGEKTLWRAVICRAMYDVMNNPSKVAERMECDHSIAWLLGKSEDFLTVSSLAGLDPNMINSHTKSIIGIGATTNTIVNRKKHNNTLKAEKWAATEAGTRRVVGQSARAKREATTLQAARKAARVQAVLVKEKAAQDLDKELRAAEKRDLQPAANRKLKSVQKRKSKEEKFMQHDDTIVSLIQGGRDELPILDSSVQQEIEYQEFIIDEKQDEIENARSILTKAISDQSLAKFLICFLRELPKEAVSENKKLNHHKQNSLSKFDTTINAMLHTKPQTHNKNRKRA